MLGKHLIQEYNMNAKGLTLVELLIASSVAAILFAVGLPLLQGFVQNSRIQSVTYDLTQSINLTRSEALKRNADVTLSPKSSDWINGWTVTANADTIKNRGKIKDVTITGPNSVTFSRNGRLNTNGTLSFAVDSDVMGYALKRCVTISLGGRVSLIVDGDDDGDCYNG